MAAGKDPSADPLTAAPIERKRKRRLRPKTGGGASFVKKGVRKENHFLNLISRAFRLSIKPSGMPEI
ncbi:MAG: hypothetical protein ACI4OI_04050, partial [Gemmiger sp.]